jgi:hypothetical protein
VRESVLTNKDLLAEYAAGMSYLDFHVALRIRRGIYDSPENVEDTGAKDDDWHDEY